MTQKHRQLSSGKWFNLTLAEQMANIGSEVHRVTSWQVKGDPNSKKQAAERALELINLTMADQRWHKGRLKEIARLREVFCDVYLGEQIYHVAPSTFNNYFLPFALITRKQA